MKANVASPYRVSCDLGQRFLLLISIIKLVQVTSRVCNEEHRGAVCVKAVLGKKHLEISKISNDQHGGLLAELHHASYGLFFFIIGKQHWHKNIESFPESNYSVTTNTLANAILINTTLSCQNSQRQTVRVQRDFISSNTFNINMKSLTHRANVNVINESFIDFSDLLM